MPPYGPRVSRSVAVMRLFIRLLVGLASLSFVACDDNDIGDPCPQLLRGEDPGASSGVRSESEETVEQNASFPCDELICIATTGRPGYCSKKCRENAGCPAGFECRTVQELGPFANDKFCAWKKCQKRSDCGGTGSDFCCSAVSGADPSGETKYCEFSNDGKCN